MKEHAVWDNGIGSPVPVTAIPAKYTPRDEHGKPCGSPIQFGISVRLPFGHEMFAKLEHLTPINEQEYLKMVKEEKAEKERLSKKEGLSCEFLSLRRHGTGAGQERGR